MISDQNNSTLASNGDNNDPGPGCHKNSDPAGSAKSKQTFIMGQCSMYNLIVYPDRAHVYRKEQPRFNANEVTEVLFDCVSPAIHKDSIRVELRGRATILDVSLNEYPINETCDNGVFTTTSDQIVEDIRQCRKEIEMISAKIMRAEKQRELLHTYADKMTAKTAGDDNVEECVSQAEPASKKCSDKHKDKQAKDHHHQMIQMHAIDKELINPFDPQTMDTLNRFLSTYEEQIEKLDGQILDGQDDLTRLDQRIDYLENKLVEVQIKNEDNFHRELSVIVEPRETGPVEIIVSYVVGKCGWAPSYDIRMFNSDGSMKIIYYGMVTQLTGEDWAKIPKMSLSTAEPGLGGTVPQLGLQTVQYKHGSILPMANLESKKDKKTESSKKPVVPDDNCCQIRADYSCHSYGRMRHNTCERSSLGQNPVIYETMSNRTLTRDPHHLNVTMICRDNSHTNTLQRATSVLDTNRSSKNLDHKHAFAQSLLVNSGPPGAHCHPNMHTTIKSVPESTSKPGSLPHVNFEVPRPLALIKSDGRDHRATVGLIDVHAPHYDYVSVPKRSPYAFLKAKAVNDSPFYLLAGQTNIYSDNSFIGKIDLSNIAPGEEFSCQLGSEHGIKLAYKPMFKAKNTHGNKCTVSFKQSIDVKNTFDREIKLTVIDQLPVSGEDKIKINLIEPHIKNPDKYDPKKPIRMNKNSNIEWDLVLKPNEQKELVLKFSVEHPANEELEVVCSEPVV